MTLKEITDALFHSPRVRKVEKMRICPHECAKCPEYISLFCGYYIKEK